MVSGSISLPSRGSFHLSLTVLFAIGQLVVFSLTGWTPRIHTGFLVSCATLDTTRSTRISVTGLLPCFAALSNALHLSLLNPKCGPNPTQVTPDGLGSSAFARHYLRNHCFIFFSSTYLDVSVQRVPSDTTMYSSHSD